MGRLLVWLGILALAGFAGTSCVANYNAARERPGTMGCQMMQRRLADHVGETEAGRKLAQGLTEPHCVRIPDEVFDELKTKGLLDQPRCPGTGQTGLYCLVSWEPYTFCLAHGDHTRMFPLNMPAREQLKRRKITDPAILAAAWDHPAPGYEGGLSSGQGKLVILLFVLVAGAAASPLLRR